MVGYCPACGNTLAIGQSITKASGRDGWHHALCCTGDGPRRTGETLVCSRAYYVSVIDPDNLKRRALIMGPFLTPEMAYGAIPEARRLADRVDPFASFFAFGIASGDVLKTRFGIG